MPYSRDSSLEVQSQADPEEQDFESPINENSISQAPFATQVPIVDNDHASHSGPNQLQPQRPHSTQTETVLEPFSTTDDLRALFKAKGNATGRTTKESLDSSVPHELRQSTTGVVAESNGAGGMEDADDDDIVSRPLIAPPTLGESILDSETRQSQASKQSKPDSSLPLLIEQYGLELGLNGRLSQRICHIPDDQARLLQSDDKWYPRLVGSSTPKPTVPLALLNQFSAQADQPELEPFMSDQLQVDVEQKTPPRLVKLERSSQRCTSDTSDDSDGQTEALDWSVSPVRVATTRALPPDSPSENRLAQTIRDDQINGHLIESTSQEEGRQRYSAENHVEELLEATPGQKEFDPLGRSSTIPRTSSTQKLSNSLDSSEDVQTASLTEPLNSQQPYEGDPTTSLTRSVQVDRTPSLIKQESSPPAPNTVTSIVPATFDERHPISPLIVEGARSMPEVVIQNVSIKQQSFEDNSSEDDIQPTALIVALQDVSAASSSEGAQAIARSKVQDPKLRRMASPSNGCTSHKRDLSSSIQTNEVRAKRQRMSESPDGEGRHISPSYHQLDSARRNDRREFLGKLVRKNDEAGFTRSIANLKTSDTISASNSNPIRKGRRYRSGSNTVRDSEQSLSVSPSPQAFTRSEKSSIPPAHTMQKSPTELKSPEDLYSIFKSVYSAYKGAKKDFEASCQLLRATRAQSSLHPSLWDAFIFRHYHDYRPYLHVIIEEAGTAISYSEFFDKILDPGYTKRVVTPALLDVEQRSSSAVPPVNQGTVSLQRGYSVDVDSLASGHYSRQRRQTTTDPVVQVVAEQVEESEGEGSHSPGKTKQSVQAWLERARGERSPILGTIDAAMTVKGQKQNTSEAEIIQLQSDKKRKRIKYRPLINEAPLTINTTPRKTRQVSHANGSGSKKGTASKPGTTIQDLSTAQQKQKKILIDTVFKQFARDYSNLPGEGARRPDTASPNFIDVFRWSG